MTYEKHRIIAVAAATGRIGCVLLVGEKVEQCKMLRRSRLKPAIAARQTQNWIRDMNAEGLVTENVGFHSRKSKNTIRNIHAIIAEGNEAGLVVVTVFRTKRFKNKYDEAVWLANRHPEMKAFLPRQHRKCFETENRKLILFEALSMARTAYGWDSAVAAAE